jgi:site-specific DNA-methyltransferase (adenine-specific)
VSQVLVAQSSVLGDLVLDPFMGSGSAGVAAVLLDRNFVGNDISEASLKLARSRLTEAGASEHELVQPIGHQLVPGVSGLSRVV